MAKKFKKKVQNAASDAVESSVAAVKKPVLKAKSNNPIVNPPVVRKAEHVETEKAATKAKKSIVISKDVQPEVVGKKLKKKKKKKSAVTAAVVSSPAPVSEEPAVVTPVKPKKLKRAAPKDEDEESPVVVAVKKSKKLKQSNKEQPKQTNAETTQPKPAAQMKVETIPPEEALKYLRYSVSEEYPSERHLFLKKDLSNDQSLIVSNIPAYIDSKVIPAFISQFVKVPIEEFSIQRSNAENGSLSYGQLTGSVLFESAAGVRDALANCQSVGPYRASDFAALKDTDVLSSSAALYRSIFSSPDQIKQAISEYMEAADISAKEARMEARRKTKEPDEDGWITVTRSSKKVSKLVKLKRNEIPLVGGLGVDKKKKQGVDLAFYTHQMKASRLKQAIELQSKFEEDKKRIALLKNSRKFKPI